MEFILYEYPNLKSKDIHTIIIRRAWEDERVKPPGTSIAPGAFRKGRNMGWAEKPKRCYIYR